MHLEMWSLLEVAIERVLLLFLLVTLLELGQLLVVLFLLFKLLLLKAQKLFLSLFKLPSSALSLVFRLDVILEEQGCLGHSLAVLTHDLVIFLRVSDDLVVEVRTNQFGWAP